MRIRISDAARVAIEDAINRGNDVKIQRKGNDVIVREIKQKTIYSARPIVGEQGQ